MCIRDRATPVTAQTLQPLDRIVAVVDEDVILQSELDRAVANVTAQYAKNPERLPPRNVLERQVLERLVLVKLQVARAASTGIRISDDELNNAMGAVAQQNGISVDALRQRLAADGLSVAEFRNSIRDEMTVQRLRDVYKRQLGHRWDARTVRRCLPGPRAPPSCVRRPPS